MSDHEPAPREEFEQWVRDCLAHLYDFTFLQTQPLVQLLVQDLTGASRVQRFREIVLEAVESLRPPPEIGFHDKQARFYNILALRYVERQQAQEVIQQLALSDRQFYRDHPRAIEILSSILWERLTGAVLPEVVISHTDVPADVSVETEVRRLHSVHGEAEQNQVDLETLIEGAVASVAELAAEHEITIAFCVSGKQTAVQANRTILRQAILWLLMQLTVRSAEGEELDIVGEIYDYEYRINFTLRRTKDLLVFQSFLIEQEALQHLVNALGGTLQFSDALPFRVTLHIPLRQRTILIIDDNPDIPDLFQRYLANHPYVIRVAHTGERAIDLARTSQPNLIILDLMLPGQDGFEILQNLKNHHSTQHIPIVICSVLEMSDLTRSLGANAYLKKPPGQADFLSALAQWLA